MGFSVFLALLVHAILLFGIGISQLEPHLRSSHVTLQLGLSGDLSTQQTDAPVLSDNVKRNIETKQSLSEEKTPPITAVVNSIEETQNLKEPSNTAAQQSAQKFNTRGAIEAFSRFQASIDSQRPTTQGLSRTRALNSFSKFTAPEAAYLNTWRRKCERIGRNNYPAGVLEGELTMLVSILRDGSLAGVKILRSSGKPRLDEAALATVRQAAPFQPFTVEMRKSYDRLDFTRTWQFSKQGTGIDF
jgi:protein TonB